MVEAFGDQLLAGAALADHQHRPIERRGAAGALDRVEKGRGLADQMSIPFHATNWDYFPPFGNLDWRRCRFAVAFSAVPYWHRPFIFSHLRRGTGGRPYRDGPCSTSPTGDRRALSLPSHGRGRAVGHPARPGRRRRPVGRPARAAWLIRARPEGRRLSRSAAAAVPRFGLRRLRRTAERQDHPIFHSMQEFLPMVSFADARHPRRNMTDLSTRRRPGKMIRDDHHVI